jgi:CCR4-NOT transcription complex subunit 7/8
MLKDCGIDFLKLKRRGIDPFYFAEKIIPSGLVLNNRVHWICFHGCQDFGYLMKTLTNDLLPPSKDNFLKLLSTFFPNVYDLKTFMHQLSPSLEGGLSRVAENLSL